MHERGCKSQNVYFKFLHAFVYLHFVSLSKGGETYCFYHAGLSVHLSVSQKKVPALSFEYCLRFVRVVIFKSKVSLEGNNLNLLYIFLLELRPLET